MLVQFTLVTTSGNQWWVKYTTCIPSRNHKPHLCGCLHVCVRDWPWILMFQLVGGSLIDLPLFVCMCVFLFMHRVERKKNQKNNNFMASNSIFESLLSNQSAFIQSFLYLREYVCGYLCAPALFRCSVGCFCWFLWVDKDVIKYSKCVLWWTMNYDDYYDCLKSFCLLKLYLNVCHLW